MASYWSSLVGEVPGGAAQVPASTFAGLDRVVEGVEGPVRRLHPDHEAVGAGPQVVTGPPSGGAAPAGISRPRRELPGRGVGAVIAGPDVPGGAGAPHG